MFDIYDNIDKKYQLTLKSTGFYRKLTVQELYDFYIFDKHDIHESFQDILQMLDKGIRVVGVEYEWDWIQGTDTRMGDLIIQKIWVEDTPPAIPKTCSHIDRYINTAGGTKFWFCRICRKDLGDVK